MEGSSAFHQRPKLGVLAGEAQQEVSPLHMPVHVNVDCASIGTVAGFGSWLAGGTAFAGCLHGQACLHFVGALCSLCSHAVLYSLGAGSTAAALPVPSWHSSP